MTSYESKEQTTEERVAAIRARQVGAPGATLRWVTGPETPHEIWLDHATADIAWLLDALDEARRDSRRLDWLGHQVVDVSKQARYGSFRIFIKAPEDREGELSKPWNVRAAIDAASLSSEDTSNA